MKRTELICSNLFFLILLSACLSTRVSKTVFSPTDFNMINTKGAFKVHLKDGGLYVLKSWKTDQSGDTVTGYGKLYNYKRELLGERVEVDSKSILPFSIPKSSITLIETAKLEGNTGNLAAISIAGVPLSVMSIYCLSNPKACFGSCPTFYARKNDKWTLMAEGFSSSISPSFEKRDIDMLYGADDAYPNFRLKLTNEALETHVIRYVDLLLFPKSAGEHVFATNEGEFFRTGAVIPPQNCSSEEDDFRTEIAAMDGIERYTPADPKNLARREELIVSFDNNDLADKGLVIGARQTLMTTYLFYQEMAYMGNHYGAKIADVENGNGYLKKRIDRLWDKLGGIEVFMKLGNSWKMIDEIREMGPIASDVHLVKLPPAACKEITLKLRLTKGLWRIDQLGLTSVISREIPVRIKPDLVLRDDTPDNKALEQLTGGISPLVTLPGDKYELQYTVPDNCSYQYFIDTKGYYLEWMREKWLEEENLKKAAVALYFPGLFMRKAAAGYKNVEPQMEKVFWESRYVKP